MLTFSSGIMFHEYRKLGSCLPPQGPIYPRCSPPFVDFAFELRQLDTLPAMDGGPGALLMIPVLHCCHFAMWVCLPPDWASCCPSPLSTSGTWACDVVFNQMYVRLSQPSLTMVNKCPERAI